MPRLTPHVGRPYLGPIIDYNGVGLWSVEGIRGRYAEAAALLGTPVHQLIPQTISEGGRTWIFPLMDAVISRIEQGDAAAIEIGIDFIEEDEFFDFGMRLKSNTARALQRASLTPGQQLRIRRRIVAMLIAGNVPPEFSIYKRLLRKVGIGDLWPEIGAKIDRSNEQVMRHYDYLQRYARE